MLIKLIYLSMKAWPCSNMKSYKLGYSFYRTPFFVEKKINLSITAQRDSHACPSPLQGFAISCDIIVSRV